MKAGAVVLAFVVVCAVAAGAWLWRSRQVEPPRNLILISIDTLRADHLGMFGYRRDTSPVLDAFAGRSTLFRRAVSQGSSTLPGHGALLTGRYPASYNRLDESTGPPPWVDTLAEILQRAGFATAGFVDGGYMRGLFGFDQGFDHWEDRRVKLRAILGSAERWLARHTADRFFLFVHCYDVHTPYNAPPPFGTTFVDPEYKGTFRPNSANFTAVQRGRMRFDAADLEYAIARYDGGIRHVDHHLGRFLSSLEQRGLLDSTIVVITSDHGEEFREHGRFLHWQLYFHPHLHVPLIVYVPARPARSVEETVELADVVPTVLDLLDLPPHADVMGRSLVPLIDGRPGPEDVSRIAFSQPGLPGPGWRSVTSNRYQLLFNMRSGRRRLFDLERDPGQQTDVAAEQPEVAEALLAVLRERLAESERRNSGPPTVAPVIDETTRRQLEELGYLER